VPPYCETNLIDSYAPALRYLHAVGQVAGATDATARAGLTSIVRVVVTGDHCDAWDPLPEPAQFADAHPACGPVDLPFVTGRRCQGAALSNCSAMCRPAVWMALALLHVLMTFGTWPTAARRPHQPATRCRLSAHLRSGSGEGHRTKGSGRVLRPGA